MNTKFKEILELKNDDEKLHNFLCKEFGLDQDLRCDETKKLVSKMAYFFSSYGQLYNLAEKCDSCGVFEDEIYSTILDEEWGKLKDSTQLNGLVLKITSDEEEIKVVEQILIDWLGNLQGAVAEDMASNFLFNVGLHGEITSCDFDTNDPYDVLIFSNIANLHLEYISKYLKGDEKMACAKAFCEIANEKISEYLGYNTILEGKTLEWVINANGNPVPEVGIEDDDE